MCLTAISEDHTANSLVVGCGSGWCVFLQHSCVLIAVLSLVASIMTLTFIACDRFFGIVFAMKAHFIERRASCTIVVLWLLALAVASPLLVYRELFTVSLLWCLTPSQSRRIPLTLWTVPVLVTVRVWVYILGVTLRVFN